MTTDASTPADPFGIRAATAAVMTDTAVVTIDAETVQRVARRMGAAWSEPPAWDDALHYRGAALDTAGWVVVLDTLNFCFWGQGDDPSYRWRVTWRGATHNGYDALAAALHRAVVDDGVPIWEAAWLRSLTLERVAHLLRGDAGCPAIPLLEARLANLRELGEALDAHAGELVEAAGGSAVALVGSGTDRLPSFLDVAAWRRPDGSTLAVPLLKRAQILAADLAGGLAGDALAPTAGLDRLTAFADYKVPQVLRQLGVLRYAPGLAGRVARLERLAAGGPEEVAIRAATVQACEALAGALAVEGRETTAAALDWRLWSLGQALPADAEPYHRTVTIFY